MCLLIVYIINYKSVGVYSLTYKMIIIANKRVAIHKYLKCKCVIEIIKDKLAISLFCLVILFLVEVFFSIPNINL